MLHDKISRPVDTNIIDLRVRLIGAFTDDPVEREFGIISIINSLKCKLTAGWKTPSENDGLAGLLQTGHVVDHHREGRIRVLLHVDVLRIVKSCYFSELERVIMSFK